MIRSTESRTRRSIAVLAIALTTALTLWLTAGLVTAAPPEHVDAASDHASSDGGETASISPTHADLRPDWTATLMEVITGIGIVTITLGIVLVLYRMLRGEHLADRVLAADALALHVVGLVILLAIRLGTEVFFDAALVVAIIGFASTLAFAQYIGNRRKERTA